MQPAANEGGAVPVRPAGAECAPLVSVVMPVYNAEATLDECLARLFQSSFPAFEVVVVDDGCTDGSRGIMERYPVRIVSTTGRVGPAVARNQGAAVARGEYLFFIDSDVMVGRDTLQLLVDGFEREGVDGFCGVQSAAMRHDDVVSQYKNLWMRWTYLRKQGEVPLFYTTAAAIRRDAFERVGGFDAGYATPNVEDTAFGQKLDRLGVRIRIHPQLEVEHVKRYSLGGLLRVDYMRAVSLTRLKLRHPDDLGDNNTSVPMSYMASVPLAGLAGIALVVGLLAGWRWAIAVGVLAGLGVVVLNANFLGAIRRSDGWGRALASVPLLWLELFVVGVGTAVGMLSFAVGRRY
jgi:glycosyltransferase involved in cell wall biosynthesis